MKFNIINSFPDFKENGFCMAAYNKQFRESNIIIHAKANQIDYPKHWGPLSIKCAMNGTEYYCLNNSVLAVDENKFLILNEGNYYNSYIHSNSQVESFTINFAPELIKDALASFGKQDDFIMENLGYFKTGIEFYEKLYNHSEAISPLIYKLKNLSQNFNANVRQVEEICFLLIEKLIEQQKKLQNEIHQVSAIKLSTKKELYKRLIRAKDYIDSCYNKDISLADLASVSLLNQTYLLRQFKNYFKITPRQYIINKRLQVARQQLDAQKDISITDICLEVGYSDLASFSKLFKQVYKYSPENYKKLIAKKVHD